MKYKEISKIIPALEEHIDYGRNSHTRARTTGHFVKKKKNDQIKKKNKNYGKERSLFLHLSFSASAAVICFRFGDFY